jgi:hypothetical protein
MDDKSQSLPDIISEALEGVAFGTVTLTLKRAHHNTVQVDLTKVTGRKVTGNAQALSLIGTMLKMLKEAKDTGNLTFTVGVTKGEADQLMVHDFDRKMLRSDGQYRA